MSRFRRPVRRVPRTRLVATVAGLVLITVAAVGYRLSEPDDFKTVRGTVGTPVAYGDGGVVIDDPRVGTVVRTSTNDRITTSGMFVVVRVAARASGTEALNVNHLQLLADDAVYLPARNESLRAEPGFEESRDVLFEVNPLQIERLTVQAWGTQGAVTAFSEHVRVPLGVTAANADAWRRAAQGTEVDYVISSVGRGLE